MDWRKGFSARYYMTLVDKSTWRDIDRLDITDGSIRRSPDGLRQSADITAINYAEKNERFIRIWLDVSQAGSSSRIALFTGLATSPERNINGKLVSHGLQCYSVLKPASDILLPRGWYAPVGINVIWQIRQLLEGLTVVVDDEYSSLNLKQAIVAEQNETRLSMVDVLLNTINWRMTLDGYGRVYLSPYPTEPIAVFDARDNDIVEPTISDDNDWFDCPNVLRCVMDGTYAEVRDENPKSKFSIPNRGREVWAEETSCNLNENETLAEYARRRLKELQQTGRKISYDRRFMPDIMPTDIIRLNYPAQDLLGNFIVTEQSITLGAGCKTSEDVLQI